MAGPRFSTPVRDAVRLDEQAARLAGSRFSTLVRVVVGVLVATAAAAGCTGGTRVDMVTSPQAVETGDDVPATSTALPVGVPTRSPSPVPVVTRTPEVPSAATPDPGVEAFLTSLPRDLDSILAREFENLAKLSARWNPNGQISLAVVLPDESLHGINHDVPRISASAVKPLWTAAALHGAGVQAVRPLAFDVLIMSDNSAGGRMIDLAGGVDAVNAWTWDAAELAHTRLEAWRFDDLDRVAEDFRPEAPLGNRTTVADLARFYALLHQGRLLDPDESSVLSEWLRDTSHDLTSPRDLDGVLLDRLPPEVAASALHKAGWLKPGCCRADYRQMIDAGLVVLPGGGWFALAVVAARGEYYDLSNQWVSLAACRIYAVLAGDDELVCERDEDGVHDPEIWSR